VTPGLMRRVPWPAAHCIWVDAAYAVAFAASAVIGRPLAGIGYGLLFGRRALWREDARLRRAFTVATALWALVYATRALVQALFYQGDQPGLLGEGTRPPLLPEQLPRPGGDLRRHQADRPAHRPRHPRDVGVVDAAVRRVGVVVDESCTFRAVASSVSRAARWSAMSTPVETPADMIRLFVSTHRCWWYVAPRFRRIPE
jgi:Protein of unknown function (DUF3159)